MRELLSTMPFFVVLAIYLFLVILAVLWFLLPLIVYQLRNRLDKVVHELNESRAVLERVNGNIVKLTRAISRES